MCSPLSAVQNGIETPSEAFSAVETKTESKDDYVHGYRVDVGNALQRLLGTQGSDRNTTQGSSQLPELKTNPSRGPSGLPRVLRNALRGSSGLSRTTPQRVTRAFRVAESPPQRVTRVFRVAETHSATRCQGLPGCRGPLGNPLPGSSGLSRPSWQPVARVFRVVETHLATRCQGLPGCRDPCATASRPRRESVLGCGGEDILDAVGASSRMRGRCERRTRGCRGGGARRGGALPPAGERPLTVALARDAANRACVVVRRKAEAEDGGDGPRRDSRRRALFGCTPRQPSPGALRVHAETAVAGRHQRAVAGPRQRAVAGPGREPNLLNVALPRAT
jgi:hypothetical protein